MTLPVDPAIGRGARIAVIGAGIAGMASAWLLRNHADVTLFEAGARAGGHADTALISTPSELIPVDCGFIVYNETNYPNLTALFAALGVETIASEMSFAVSVDGGAMEYGGGTLGQVFAQKSNLLNRRFLAMLRDILRFYREAPALLAIDAPATAIEESLGDYLMREGYGQGFIEDHILPMGAAIWSGTLAGMEAFPARHFVRFFANHGLLKLTGRPQWRSVAGGSRNYVAALMRDLRQPARFGQAVVKLRRAADGVLLHLADGSSACFDQVILACHADQALTMIEQPSAPEHAILGAMRFQENEAVLHGDVSLMPRRQGVWSAWNFLLDRRADRTGNASVTYWMNRLQNLPGSQPILLSLNPQHPPAPALVHATRRYSHPQFDAAAMAAQGRLPTINGADRLWFAGAWTGWGFHEDGIASAVAIATAMGVAPPWPLAPGYDRLAPLPRRLVPPAERVAA